MQRLCTFVAACWHTLHVLCGDCGDAQLCNLTHDNRMVSQKSTKDLWLQTGCYIVYWYSSRCIGKGNAMEVLQEEARMPLTNQEGPIGLIVCPSRELARQTYDVILLYAEAIQHETVLPNPKIRVMLCIGATFSGLFRLMH